VEGGAFREWFGTEPNRWWYVITTTGSSGWLPEDALGDVRPPDGGIPTRTATPTPSPTLTPLSTVTPVSQTMTPSATQDDVTSTSTPLDE
jgi:hypothetical protein